MYMYFYTELIIFSLFDKVVLFFVFQSDGDKGILTLFISVLLDEEQNSVYVRVSCGPESELCCIITITISFI